MARCGHVTGPLYAANNAAHTMSPLKPLDGPRVAPANGGPVRQLVILLHGLGADGNDLIGLAPHLAGHLPGAAFVAPNAPEPCDIAPGRYQWFGLRMLSAEEIDRGVRHAARILDAFIDSELDRAGLDEDNLALVGFSQGTMMALHVGLRRAHACAGIVGFSGRLADAKALKGEICAKPPVLLVHGESDELIPTAALFDAVSELGTAGLEVEWHVSAGLGHGIDETGLHLSCDFLSRVLREPST